MELEGHIILCSEEGGREGGEGGEEGIRRSKEGGREKKGGL